MASRITTVGVALVVACCSSAALAGCGEDSNGIRVRTLDTDDARQALSDIDIDVPEGFEARDFTSSASFTGQTAYHGRFDGTDPADVAVPDFNELNPDTPLSNVLCNALPVQVDWSSLDSSCTDGAFSTHLRSSDGNEISIVLQASAGGTHLFVAESGT